ncbi:hypothetical protein C8Q80DRAFT_425116 [Daedaleopsis nitida]|nr:hypothetical protein C8Q80DRAFT_425116 [Daedaleopsis nitida]
MPGDTEVEASCIDQNSSITICTGKPSIHDLPNEILVHVFAMFAALTDGQLQRRRSKRRQHPRLPTSHWVHLMCVCRHWREIGIQTPRLWQIIHVDKTPEWLALSLERSREAPIDIAFRREHVVRTSLSTVLTVAHRLRKLLLPHISDANLHILLPLFDTHMPILEEFRLCFRQGSDETSLDPAPPTSAESPLFSFVTTNFPVLRYLRLFRATFPWCPPTVSRLRFLHLHRCCSLDLHLTFERLLDVLDDCTQLEDLHLHHFLSTISYLVPATFSRMVVIPALKSLFFTDTPALCRQFLSCFDIPAHITLFVTANIDDSVNFSHARGLFMSMLPQNRDKLHILRCATEASFVYASQLGARTADGAGSITLSLYCESDIDQYTEAALEEFVALFAPAPIEDLRVSCVRGVLPESGDFWSPIFASFPSVRTLLVATGHTVRPIWDALSEREQSDDAEGRQANPILPLLERVTMKSFKWEEEAMDYVLECLRRRTIWRLPKLANLEIYFYTSSVVTRKFEEAVQERMDMFYGPEMAPYTDRFVWKVSYSCYHLDRTYCYVY